MKEVGGYFEIEFSNIKLGDIHPNAIKLNTGRNCLEYILLANRYKKIFVPYYTCDAALEPIIKHNIIYEFYHIDKNLEPINIPICKSDEAFLYNNYFGIKEHFTAQLADKFGNLIVDNSQALFAAPVDGIDTFYSLRKFLGVPDGAFLYSKKHLDFHIEKAVSADRVAHLYKRKDVTAAFGYNSFKADDESLIGMPLMAMSSSTESFLKTYDFEKNKITRERNFLFLHYNLKNLNEFEIDASNINSPLCYPFLKNGFNSKQVLINNGIYIPTYWTNVLAWIKEKDCVEKILVDDMLALPVDHRYNLDDLKFVIENLSK